jgi:hypothetical protein
VSQALARSTQPNCVDQRAQRLLPSQGAGLLSPDSVHRAATYCVRVSSHSPRLRHPNLCTESAESQKIPQFAGAKFPTTLWGGVRQSWIGTLKPIDSITILLKVSVKIRSDVENDNRRHCRRVESLIMDRVQQTCRNCDTTPTNIVAAYLSLTRVCLETQCPTCGLTSATCFDLLKIDRWLSVS